LNPAPANREPAVDQLAEVWTSIRSACHDLGPGQWEAPTDCPGWSVRDHISHLVGIERMLLGDPAPEALGEYPPHVRNEIGRLNEAWVESRRSTPGPEVLREFAEVTERQFAEVTERRLAELRALPAAHFDVVSESLLGRMAYRQFVQTRVVDSWAHEQDVRRALDRPGGRNGAGEAVVVEGCARNMPRVVAREAAVVDGSVVVFDVSGLLGRRITVVVADGRGRLVEDGTAIGPATTTLSMDQEAFWRLCFGRVEPVRLLATGQVRIDGDVAVGHKVLDAMAFIP